MASSVSVDVASRPPVRWEETLQIALLLAFSGGYLDAYTWVVHGVMANTQTANLVLLWVHGTAGDWDRAMHFIPPMMAFILGVAIATETKAVPPPSKARARPKHGAQSGPPEPSKRG